jgi:uncharacterized protein YkwD
MRSAATKLRGLVAAWLIAIVVIPASASASTRQDRTEASILRAMNHVRARHHLPQLRVNGALARAADAHSAAMLRSGQFSHGAMTARLRRYTRSRAIGENLAWMSRCNGRKVVGMWLKSAPHRRNMLARRFKVVGVGRRSGSGLCMITADFASAR